MLLWVLAFQPALAEGYGPDRGVGVPAHREDWISDGYWLDGTTGAWPPAYRPVAPEMERYRPPAEETAVTVPPPWPADYPGYGSVPFADDTYYPNLRSTYTSYGRAIPPGRAAVPFSGIGFRPLEQVPETGRPLAPFGGHAIDPYAAPRQGRDTYSFRPELEPQTPERVSPVWYRERVSGKRYLFRPVSPDELVSRPSDHSFNSPRYTQPESADHRYLDPNRFAPPQGGPYGAPGRPYSNFGGWGGDAYGGPIYGFE